MNHQKATLKKSLKSQPFVFNWKFAEMLEALDIRVRLKRIFGSCAFLNNSYKEVSQYTSFLVGCILTSTCSDGRLMDMYMKGLDA